jgi:hypothetical protein
LLTKKPCHPNTFAQVYEFAYDTVRGRRQLGVVGSELESVLPEAVDVVRSQAFKNPDTSPGAPALVKVLIIKAVHATECTVCLA